MNSFIWVAIIRLRRLPKGVSISLFPWRAMFKVTIKKSSAFFLWLGRRLVWIWGDL